VRAVVSGRRDRLSGTWRACRTRYFFVDEECDDGNAVDGDGCESDCRRTPCVGGTVLDQASLKRGPRGSLKLTGHLLFPPSVPAGFDPSMTGIQVMLEDLGAPASAFEVSARNGTPIPGGPGCGPADGWTVSKNGAVQSYSNQSGALDALCVVGSAYELRSVHLQDRRATRGDIVFSLKAGNGGAASFGMNGVPNGLRVTVVLGSTAGDGLAGACATRVFDPSECEIRLSRYVPSDLTRVRCR